MIYEVCDIEDSVLLFVLGGVIRRSLIIWLSLGFWERYSRMWSLIFPCFWAEVIRGCLSVII